MWALFRRTICRASNLHNVRRAGEGELPRATESAQIPKGCAILGTANEVISRGMECNACNRGSRQQQGPVHRFAFAAIYTNQDIRGVFVYVARGAPAKRGGSHMFSNRTVLSFSTMTTSDVPENAISMTLRPARWSKEPWFSFMSKRKMFPRLSAAAIRSPQVVNETAEKLPDIGRGMDKNNPVSTSGFGVLEVFHSCVVLLPPLSRLWSPLMDRFSR